MFTDAMTQPQVRPTVLSDCQYNIVKQLEKELQFLWCVDGYIKDAEKEGNSKCAQAFRQIKEDEEKHAKMLKELLSSTVQS
jgi:rubrerythrin